MTDLLVVDHGSILPVSATARQWLDVHIVSELWQWVDSAVAVNHRCAREILRSRRHRFGDPPVIGPARA
jgi:hypothetical protein